MALTPAGSLSILPRWRPSTRSMREGLAHVPSVANASALMSSLMSVRVAKEMSKSNSLSPPTRKAALMARLRMTSEVIDLSCNLAANAGNAPMIDKSSLIPRAASATMYSSLSLRNTAILSFFILLKTNTAAVRKALLGLLAKATIGSTFPILDNANTPA